MGTVYEGVHVETNERAAVKSLAADLGSEADFRKRFGQEIETLRRLRHPSIVRLFGFGEQDGQLFYSMELVDGVSIETELRQGRRFSWKEAIDIGKQICLALRHAHDRGIIHRDLKPANLILSENNSVKLADFGIARFFGDTRITTAGGVIGTVEYMAPEQAAAKPIDYRADLYALGGVLFAMLAGRPPLVSRSLPEMLEKLKSERPERVDRIVLDAPEELAILIDQLLDKNPKKRVANAMLIERRLEAIEHGLEHRQAQQEAAAAELEHDFDVDPPSDSKKLKGEPPVSTPTNLAVTQALEGAERTPPVVMQPTQALEPDQQTPHEEPPEGSTYAQDPMARAQTITDVLPKSGSKSNSKVTRTMTDQEKSDSQKRTGKIQQAGTTNGDTHFTEVDEEELDQAFTEAKHSAMVSIQTWILTGCLVLVGGTIWYSLQPASADSVYRKIENAVQEDSAAALRNVESDIKFFLGRYSNDPRAKQVRDYEEKLELYLLKRRLDNQLKNQPIHTQSDPVVRAYLEAQHYLEIEPEVGMKKLQALIDLYAHERSDSTTGDRCVRLAQQQMRELKKELKKAAQAHEDLLNAQLEQIGRAHV